MALNYYPVCPNEVWRVEKTMQNLAVENLLVLECFDTGKVGKAKAKMVLSVEAPLYVHIKDTSEGIVG